MKQLLFLPAAPLVAALLLSGLSACDPRAPVAKPGTPGEVPARPPGARLSPEHDGALHYDLRYLDSFSVKPWSARTQRELALARQLRRLDMAKWSAKQQAKRDSATAKNPVQPNGSTAVSDSVWDTPFHDGVDGHLVGYPNETARMADIYRRIDSLKVLEHIPLTPH